MTKLTEDQIRDKLFKLPSWAYQNGELIKTFTFKDFNTAITCVNQVAAIANNFNHHPDIDIRYNKVTFHLLTHGEGGITEKDTGLASDIEKIVLSLL